MKVLLIQMPFFTIDSPNMGLESLCGALRESGIESDIRYLNFDFCKLVGEEKYRHASENVPQHFLLGDAVFFESLHARPLDPDQYLRVADGTSVDRKNTMESQVLDMLPGLSRQALDFISQQIEEIDWSQYGLVGFGLMFYSVPSLAFAKELKHAHPSLPIIFGGSNCDEVMGLQLMMTYPFVDFICRGEGEELIVELAKAIRDQSPSFELITGLVWRDESGAVVANGGRTNTITNMDKLPKVRFSAWVAQSNSNGFGQNKYRMLAMETSRGCWWGQKHHCIFCGLNGQVMTFRAKSPDRVMSEVEDYKRYGIKMLIAVDNIISHNYFSTVLPRLAAMDHGFSIFYETKANLNYSQLKAMRDAGIKWIQPGIESLSTGVLKRMNKGVTALQNIRLLKWATELDIGVLWNIIYGFPGEDPDDYQAMVGMVPALKHLQPPKFGSYKLRLDRFSPLFESRNNSDCSIKNVRPYRVYNAVHPLDAESVGNLAYYFDYEHADGRDVESYAKPLVEIVNEWCTSVGEAALIYWVRGDELSMFDSRNSSGAVSNVLRGDEKDIYLALGSGLSYQALQQQFGEDCACLADVIARFKREGWVLELDGKLLSIAVCMDESAPASGDEASLVSDCRELYLSRMKRLHEVGW